MFPLEGDSAGQSYGHRGPGWERGAFETLGEALRIYGLRWREFLVMSALVNAPVAAIDELAGTSGWAWALVIILSVLASAAFVGAAIAGVCQHYLFGRVDVGSAYQRAQWRYLTLLLITFVTVGALFAGLLLSWIIVPLIAAVVFTVYWSMAAPSAIVERYAGLDCLRASHMLVRDNWWRVFGALFLFVVVTALLVFLAWLPYLLTDLGSGPDASGPSSLRWIGHMVASVLVPPIPAICTALLYLDLRSRRDGLDPEMLREEYLGGAGRTFDQEPKPRTIGFGQ